MAIAPWPAFLPERAVPPIYIAILTYIRPLEEIDRHVEAHIEWLRRHYEDGTFLLSGRPGRRGVT